MIEDLEPLVVVGAGGFGREVLDVVDAVNERGRRWALLGVLDDKPTAQNVERLRRRGAAYLGALDEWLSSVDIQRVRYVIGVGSPRTRQHLAERLDHAGLRPATLVHPSATWGQDVSIAPGSVLCAGVRLTTNINVGKHVHLNLNVTVGHDTMISNFVSVNPLASISGDCYIGERALIGVGGVVLEGRRVGNDSIVGASACVVSDVPPEITVKGVPAK
jgi:sugar O-acyltransferase (sialic acid O-acetyltransferase NeuD family)